MCLGIPIKYIIKVKSKMAELFGLKKNDFMSLSVEHEKEIELFLERAVNFYINFETEYNKAVKEHFKNNIKVRNSIAMNKPLPINIQIKKSSASSTSVFAYDADLDDSNCLSKSIRPTSNANIYINHDINKHIERIKTLLDKYKKKYSTPFLDIIYQHLVILAKEKNSEQQLVILDKLETLLRSNNKLVCDNSD